MRGVIAAGNRHTAEAGAAILRAGGNAVDAAVGAAFASFIAESSISTIGGGGFALVNQAGEDPILYDFFCAMPGQNAPPTAMDALDFEGVPIDFGGTTDTYHVGRGSTAVPGNPAGLGTLLAEHGTLSLADVLHPAIGLARRGCRMEASMVGINATLPGILTRNLAMRRLFARADSSLLRPGDTFRNPPLAETLVTLGRQGWQSFYRGDLARLIVDDATQNGGLITAADLAGYRVIQRDPLHIRYRGSDIYTNPPPAAGGILILYALRLLERADLEGVTAYGASHTRLLLEIMRQANLARRRDQPNTRVNGAQQRAFLSDETIERDWHMLRERLQGDVSHSGKPGSSGYPHTTHISVVDSDGLTVAMTMTPGATGGYVIGESGILLNNILGEADLNPEGFHSAAPGTRLSSMMSPTVVDVPDGQHIALGSAGSSRIRSAIFQVLSNLLDWSLTPDRAVNRSRVHFEHATAELEHGYSPAAADALAQQGYRVNRWQTMQLYFGGVQLAIRNHDGSFGGAGDVRRGGACIVVDT